MIDRLELAHLAMRIVGADLERRAALIDEATAGRPELRDALVRVLASDAAEAGRDPLQELGRIFDDAVGETAEVHAGAAGESVDQSGSTIDRFLLLQRLGAGAAGVVYLAEQVTPVRRRVAIKLLHHGTGTPRLARRFRIEQRVLASLDHPGIARLIDTGVSRDGRPYIAMELIDGPGLGAFCRERSTPLRERVRMLAAVCDAVQHAHGRGVIHRDLKPGNIVVRLREGAAEPVVVDFGVARLLEPDQNPDHTQTSLDQAIGTRRYMSPEQRAGETIDVRSDIWSLGVTIEEILTERGDAEEIDPRELLPGDLARLQGAPPATMHREGAPRAAIAPRERVPRDLRWIIDRCCARRPDDRYQAAAELGADLRRYLASEPVAAAPPSLFYRSGRLLARHPVRTALALVALAAILGATAFAEAARRRLAREVEAQRALIGGTIDDVVDEIWVFMGSEEARAKLLGRFLARTQALLDLDPDDAELLETKARLLRALGYFHGDRSEHVEMARVHREALEIYERLAPDRAGDVEFIRAHAEACVRMGDALAEGVDRGPEPPGDVGTHWSRALEMQREALRRHPDHIGLRDDYLWSLLRMLSFESGEARTRQALAAVEFAEALLADQPTRELSKLALCTAHQHAGTWIASTSTPQAAAETHKHFRAALELAHELIHSQPHRGAYLRAHLYSLTMLTTGDLLDLSSPDELAALIDEQERALRGLDPERWSRVDVQETAVGALGALASAYARTGRDAEARETFRWLESVAGDPAITWTPRGRDALEHTLKKVHGTLGAAGG